MVFFRNILGKTKRDCIQNEAMWYELNIVSVKAKIGECQLRWFGHVWGMPDTYKTKWYIEVVPEGWMKTGRATNGNLLGLGGLGREERRGPQFAKWPEIVSGRNGLSLVLYVVRHEKERRTLVETLPDSSLKPVLLYIFYRSIFF